MTETTPRRFTPAELPALDIIEHYGLEDSYHLGTACELMLRMGHSGQTIAQLTIARLHVLRFGARMADGSALAPNAWDDVLSFAAPDEIVAAYRLEGAHAEAVLALLSWSVFGLEPVLDEHGVESECALIVRHIDAAIAALCAPAGKTPAEAV